LPDGTYQLLTVKHVFFDYQFSENHEIVLPPKEITTVSELIPPPDSSKSSKHQDLVGTSHSKVTAY
jgi:hypothetical protein